MVLWPEANPEASRQTKALLAPHPNQRAQQMENLPLTPDSVGWLVWWTLLDFPSSILLLLMVSQFPSGELFPLPLQACLLGGVHNLWSNSPGRYDWFRNGGTSEVITETLFPTGLECVRVQTWRCGQSVTLPEKEANPEDRTEKW